MNRGRADTVPFLYRGVRRLCGARAAICAASIGALTPAVVALDRGNVSDSLLILLLVLASDAVSAALISGNLAPAVLAGLFVGLAFQAKMLEAWLVLPGILGTLLLAAPGTLRRRLLVGAALLAVAVVVSLSWMTVVSAMPRQDRPYVDGTTNDSVYEQVFEYNGFGRRCRRPPAPGDPRRGKPRSAGDLRRWRTRRGLPPARRRGGTARGAHRYPPPAPYRSRSRRVRAMGVVAGCRRGGVPHRGHHQRVLPRGAGPGDRGARRHRCRARPRRSAERRRTPVLALLVALAMASAAYGFWLLAPAPLAVRVAALAAAAGCVTLALALPRRALPLLVAAATVAPLIAGIEVIVASAGPFDTPFEPGDGSAHDRRGHLIGRKVL